MDEGLSVLPVIIVGALSSVFGVIAAVAWRRSVFHSHFWYLDHPRILYISIILWSVFHLLFSIFAPLLKSIPFHATKMEFTVRVTQATIFMAIFTAYLAYWTDIYIHGDIPYDHPRKSRSPKVVYLLSTSLAFLSGAVAICLNGGTFIPVILSLEIWTTAMGIYLILTSIIVFIYLKRNHPPERSRSKEISVQVQTACLFFVCICFAIRQRMVWTPTGFIGTNSYEQVTRFVYLVAEWLAIGVMLVYGLPKPTSPSNLIPTSELLKQQWKRVKYVSGATSILSTVLTSLPFALYLKSENNIIRISWKTLYSMELSMSFLMLLGFLSSTGIFIASLKKYRPIIKPLLYFLIVTTALGGGLVFGTIMSLIIALPPFNEPKTSLILGAVCGLVQMVAQALICSFTYKLAKYIKDPSGIALVVDSISCNELEQFEQPNKELESKASTIRKFLLASMIIHGIWLCAYFVPSSISSLSDRFTWGWAIPIVSVFFVIGRLPLALFGYTSTLHYRRNSYRLIGYVITQAFLNIFGVSIVILDGVFWLCKDVSCGLRPNAPTGDDLSFEYKLSFAISAVMIFIIIYEFVINILYWRWYKKVKEQLTSLILEDINSKLDASFVGTSFMH